MFVLVVRDDDLMREMTIFISMSWAKASLARPMVVLLLRHLRSRLRTW